MPYTVEHLNSDASFERQNVVLNPLQQERGWEQQIDPAIEAFHSTLSHYNETKLHSLPIVASELGFNSVFVKGRVDKGLVCLRSRSWVHRGPSTEQFANISMCLVQRHYMSYRTL